MHVESTIWGYIDPNTSHHVFSLLGPMLAFLGTVGGLAVGVLLCIRHRIVLYCKTASRAKWAAIVTVALGALAVASVIVCRLFW